MRLLLCLAIACLSALFSSGCFSGSPTAKVNGNPSSPKTQRQSFTDNAELIKTVSSPDVDNVNFTNDGKILVLNTQFEGIQMIEIPSLKVLGKFPSPSPSSEKWTLSSDRGRLVYCGKDDHFHTITLPDQQPMQTLDCSKEPIINTFALSPDGKSLVTKHDLDIGGDSQRLTVWDLKTQKKSLEIQLEKLPRRGESTIFQLAYTPDGKHIIAERGGDLWVWSAKTGRRVAQLREETWVDDFAFTPDGKSLATALGRTRKVSFWNLKTWKKEQTLQCQEGRLSTLAFSEDGKYLAMGSCDSDIGLPAHIEIIRLRDKKSLFRVKSGVTQITSLCFRPKHPTQIAVGHHGPDVQLWDLKNALLEAEAK